MTTPGSDEAILSARARALAREPVPESAPGESVVRFQSSGMTWAVPAVSVLEVLRAPDLAWVPGAPATVAGVVAWRSELLAVTELGDGPAARDLPQTWLVVVTLEGRVAAIRAEGPGELHRYGPADLRDAPADLRAHAVGSVAGDGVLVIDVPALFHRCSL